MVMEMRRRKVRETRFTEEDAHEALQGRGHFWPVLTTE